MTRGGLVAVYSFVSLALIFAETLFVVTIRLEPFYNQLWFDELKGQSAVDAMNFIDGLLALAV